MALMNLAIQKIEMKIQKHGNVLENFMQARLKNYHSSSNQTCFGSMATGNATMSNGI